MTKVYDYEVIPILKDNNINTYSLPFLSHKMTELSSSNKYSQSQKHYEDFLKKVFSPHSHDVFHSTFLLRKNSKMYGFLNASVAFEAIDIDYIFIKDSYKRKGLGSKLMHAFFEYYRMSYKKGLDKKIFLEVSLRNTSAVSFYKKHGFKTLSIRENYYKNKEDAILMEKKI